ncbi:hypothetical protein SK128_009381 [Halocaridina rubra]|uniref:Uncharacterized protein n=1 Tax=Halocaridina rubra TaxID=373956 RepID=A0AAN8X8F4_HALRR
MEASTYKSSRSLSSVDASADVKGHNATFSSYCDNMVFHEHQGKSTGGKSITMVLHLMNLPTSMHGEVFNASHLYGKIAKIHYNPSTDDGDIMINSCTKAAARNGFNSHDNSTWNLHDPHMECVQIALCVCCVRAIMRHHAESVPPTLFDAETQVLAEPEHNSNSRAKYMIKQRNKQPSASYSGKIKLLSPSSAKKTS